MPLSIDRQHGGLMSRAGWFVVGMLVCALLTASVLAATNFFDLRITSVPSPEAELVARMNEATGGGIAVTFAHPDANRWQIAAGHRLEKLSVDRGDAVVARLTSMAPIDAASYEWPSQGLSVSFPPELGNKSNGRSIEIGVLARATPGRPGATLSLAYATRQAGNTGWKHIPLSGQFELKTLKYDVPKREEGYTNSPVLVLNADASGNGGSIELLGVYIKVL
jgi:hypothetical protein